MLWWITEAEKRTNGRVKIDAYWAQALGTTDTDFEGTAEEMWTSLSKLRNLPGDTRVYCAHEYTLANAAFALTVEPDNQALRDRARQIRALRAEGKPTVPSKIAEERATNPFLRADSEDLKRAAGLAGRESAAVFAEIRRRKDNF